MTEEERDEARIARLRLAEDIAADIVMRLRQDADNAQWEVRVSPVTRPITEPGWEPFGCYTDASSGRPVIAWRKRT